MKRTKRIKIFLAAVIVFMWSILSASPNEVYAENESDSLIRTISISIEQPLCGTYVSPGYPQENGPVLHLKEEDKISIEESPVWISIPDYLASGARNLYSGTIVGGNEYLAFVTIKAADGFHFDE